MKPAWNRQQAKPHLPCLLLLNPEDGSNKFLLNVGELSMDYAVSYVKRQNTSNYVKVNIYLNFIKLQVVNSAD
jgi:hypothetical protein